MTARSLRPERLVMTSEVMRVLKSEGLVCAEVVIGVDGKGYVRFAPEAEFEGLVVHRETDAGTSPVESGQTLTLSELFERPAIRSSERFIMHPETHAELVELGGVTRQEEITAEQAAAIMEGAPLPRFEVAHERGCHCADCVPCVHHPGEDCDCYCRFCEGCGYGNCNFWVGPLLPGERYDSWDR